MLINIKRTIGLLKIIIPPCVKKNKKTKLDSNNLRGMGGNVYKFIDIGPYSYLVGGETLNNLGLVRKT